MKIGSVKILSTFVVLAFSVVLSCQRPPDYSDTPFILFEDIEEIGPRILKVTLYFEDGDSDLGLNANGNDILPPYNPSFSVIAARNNPCQYLDTVWFSQLHPDDTADFFIAKSIRNQNGNNVDLSIYIKRQGEYILSPYGLVQDTSCNQADTIYMPELRFPRIADDIGKNPIEGNLEIDVNLEFTSVSLGDTFQLEMAIYDRALNKSNVIRTKDFAFSQ